MIYRISHYRLLRHLLAAIALCAAPLVVVAGPLSGANLFADVEQYAALGSHKRTGTGKDDAVSDWLGQELQAAGLQVQYQDWSFDRFKYNRCRLKIDGEIRECVALWYPNNTLYEDVDAQLVWVRGYNRDSMLGSTALEAAIGQAQAPVIAVNTVSDLLTAVNVSAQQSQQMMPVPAVLVSGEHIDLLEGQVLNTRQVQKLKIKGKHKPGSSSRNVIGLVDRGADSTVVISTPTTGWFTSGGERGPGVALWLALARRLVDADMPVNLLFVATSGHELGYLGLEAFLDSAAPPVGEVLYWVHLGASIVTVDDSEQRKFSALDYNDGALSAALASHLAPVGFSPQPSGIATGGELARIIDAGYTAFGFYGAFDRFHTPQDLADSTEAQALEDVAKPLRDAIKALADELSAP